MQITIKTLQQQTFKISIEPTELVSVFVLNQHFIETWTASVQSFNVATARKLPLSLTTLCQMQNLRQ